MHPLYALTAIASFLTVALGDHGCHHDDCYQAVECHESTSMGFCNQFLATPTKQIPTAFATCGPSAISSACGCLKTKSTKTFAQTTTTTIFASPTSSFVTSTCSRSSASACPTSFNPCCQYRCAVAQVPFGICSPSDTSGQFEVCSKCPVATATS